MADPRGTDGRAPFAPRLLIVDDDANLREGLERAFASERWSVLHAGDGRAALEILESEDVDAVLLDLAMPGLGGVETLERIRRAGWDVPVVVLSGSGGLDTAVRCLKLGAADYFQKPCDRDRLGRRIRELVDARLLRRERPPESVPPLLVGSSASMAALRDLVRRVAASDETVLVQGETGSGKDLVARAIHLGGPRRSEPFIPVDCATLAPSVVESELFGHVKGAFTGAEGEKAGLLQAAGGGVVFLDEVGELPLDLQPKLLRVLQSREIRPVGGTAFRRFDARVVAATHRDLAREAREGRFREDLYWRLKVLTVAVPPLRDRRDDIGSLALHFLRKYGKRSSEEGPPGLDPKALERLKAYDWPGNVRELENCIRRLAALYPEELASPARVDQELAGTPAPEEPATLEDWERMGIRSALARSGGNVPRAARRLGVSKSTLYRRIKELGLPPA